MNQNNLILIKNNSNDRKKETIMGYLEYFLNHTNYKREFKITVDYDPEIGMGPSGNISIDGAIYEDNIELPDPYRS